MLIHRFIQAPQAINKLELTINHSAKTDFFGLRLIPNERLKVTISMHLKYLSTLAINENLN